MAGDKIAHMAPPAENVPNLMKDLFRYLNTSKEITLIKSCVFHYEMEFIHPFSDGNGRMGRLWQTLILKEEYSVFRVYYDYETKSNKKLEISHKKISLNNINKETFFLLFW
jgi:Fic family protein